MCPPPYSPTPPEVPGHIVPPPFLVRRSSSTPHLHSPTEAASSSGYLPISEVPRRPSTSALHPRRSRNVYSSQPRVETSDDADTDASLSEDTVIYTTTAPSLAGTLRARLFGKDRTNERLRPITTAPGIIGAGETETESEDPPRHLPTARITPSSTPSQSLLSSLASDPITVLPKPPRSLIPLLYELFRLLSIVPAVFGTLYNIYHAIFPPHNDVWARSEYFVSALWAILTGWQCLQLTTGLLKRWRAYYRPLPTVIRLLALQAICWPATHFTLTILEYEKRPLICWALIGTTTSCSRSVQMWVTSNIIVTHHPEGLAEVTKERMKMSRRRKWDWGAVGAKCALPAGLIYFVMAWVEVLRREFEYRGSRPT
ncbi:hypothetical protein K474DRAFT_1684013 [Panus rudis PR-1116 ss-1]|nr:hypothetical protein K474DRAFT_1684013 [Panus rudis PR-1116 ss-1]